MKSQPGKDPAETPAVRRWGVCTSRRRTTPPPPAGAPLDSASHLLSGRRTCRVHRPLPLGFGAVLLRWTPWGVQASDRHLPSPSPGDPRSWEGARASPYRLLLQAGLWASERPAQPHCRGPAVCGPCLTASPPPPVTSGRPRWSCPP